MQVLVLELALALELVLVLVLELELALALELEATAVPCHLTCTALIQEAPHTELRCQVARKVARHRVTRARF